MKVIGSSKITPSLDQKVSILFGLQKNITEQWRKGLHSAGEKWRNEQEESYNDSFKKLANEDLSKILEYRKTKTFLRTKFVKQFCGALVYKTLSQTACTSDIKILENDSYASVIHKLQLLQELATKNEDTIVGENDTRYVPTRFKDVRIKVDIERQKDNYELNLKSYLELLEPQFKSFARVRISEIKVLFMDEQENILYNGDGSFFSQDVKMETKFPKKFNDYGLNGELIRFKVERQFYCNINYRNKSKKVICNITAKF